jgi:peptidoglycan hydrolase-like protein with peptidoglycan-binding domain
MPPTLQQGEYNEEWVRVLQEMLTERGIPTTADADYGPLTKEAVRDFQGMNGLKVDGICGPETWGALGVTDGKSEHTFEPEVIYGDPPADQ